MAWSWTSAKYGFKPVDSVRTYGQILAHVAILTAEFPPVGGGGVIRVAKLVKYLSELGWRVTVVTSDEHLANAYDESLLDEIPHEVTVIRAGRALATIGGSAARICTWSTVTPAGSRSCRETAPLRAPARTASVSVR